MRRTGQRRATDENGAAITARRDEIIDVAASMIAKYGYDGTKVAAIADELGILSGSLYHHIRSKQDLLFWIMERAHLDLERALAAFDLESLPADQALTTVICTHIEVGASNVALGAVSETEISRLDDEARERIIGHRRLYSDTVRSIVRRGQNDGTFRTDMHPHLAALSAMSLANSIYRWYDPARSWSPTFIGGQYASIIVDGLRSHHEEGPPPRAG